jgi:hypothetical protein
MGESLLEYNKRFKRGNGHGGGLQGSEMQRAEVRQSHLLRDVTFKQTKSIRTRALRESQTAFMNAPGKINLSG